MKVVSYLAAVVSVLLFAFCSWAQTVTAASLQRSQQLAQQAHGEQVSGDLAGALRDYREALRLQPGEEALEINLGLVEYELKDYATSAVTLRKVAATLHTQFVPYLFLGLDELALNQPQLALNDLRTAQSLNPADPQAPLAMGRALTATGAYQQAVEAYRRAAALDPMNTDILFETGMAYLTDVEQLSVRLLRQSPKEDPYVRLLYGDALLQQHRYHEALQIYTGSSSPAPEPPGLCLRARRGLALYGAGKTAEAAELWKKGQQGDARCTLALLGLAASEPEGPESASMLTELEVAVTQTSALERHDLEWATSALPASLSAQRRAQIGNMTRSGPGGDGAQNAAQRPEFDLYPLPLPAENVPRGRAREVSSVRRSNATLRCESRSDNPGVRVATTLREQGPANASRCAALALLHDPSDRELLFWSIRLDELLGSESLRRFEASAPNAPRTHLLLGDMYRQRGRYAEAQAQYHSVLEVEPENLLAWQGLAIADFHDGKGEEAIGCARHVLASQPSSPVSNQVLGEALVSRHQFAEAELPLRTALLSPRGNAALLHALLGRVEAGLGHTAEAVTEMVQGLPSDTDGSLHFLLSRLYRQTGDLEAARKAAKDSQTLSNERLQHATMETIDSGSAQEATQP